MIKARFGREDAILEGQEWTSKDKDLEALLNAATRNASFDSDPYSTNPELDLATKIAGQLGGVITFAQAKDPEDDKDGEPEGIVH